MNRQFNKKQSKDIKKIYKEYISKINNILNFNNKKESAVCDKIDSLNDSKFFIDDAKAYLHQINNENSYPTALICDLKVLKDINPIVNDSLLLNNKLDEIKRCLHDVKKGNGAIKWLFLSKHKKDKSNDAYNYLTQELNDNEIVNINTLHENFNLLKETNKEDAVKDFLDSKTSYLNVLTNTYPDGLNTKNRVNEVKQLQKTYDELNDEFANMNSEIEESKIYIDNSLKGLINQEVIKTLREMPVEEINHDKVGIHVKLLRDHGYTSIADIAAANVYQISSIYGISESGAQLIKYKCNQIISDTAKIVTVKLNYDDQNKAATSTVNSIYGYRIKQEIRNETIDLNDKYSDEIIKPLQDLSTIGNGVAFYFSDDSTKSQIRDSFNILKKDNSDYFSSAKKLIKAFNNSEINSKKAWDDFKNHTVEYYNVIEQIKPGILGKDDSLFGLSEELARQVQDECFFPDGLLCTLRSYQELGVKYILHQGKVLLGDEMGLGKTVQAIAAMVSLKNTGATHFLVVCPASVVTNWCREIVNHSKLRAIKIHSTGRIQALNAWINVGGVGVTTYETLSIFNDKIKNNFSLLVVDEAHYAKNPNANRTKNIMNISTHCDRILFMTGTALENRVDEMIALIKMLNPSIARQIENKTYLAAAPQFRKIVAPVYFRRKRADVLKELPDLIEKKQWCEMSTEEEQMYENTIFGKNYMDVRRVSWNIEDVANSSKAKRLLELVDDAKEEERKIIVFSFFRDTINKVFNLLGERACMCPITGSMSSQMRQQVIDEFDKSPAGTVLVSQIVAGGTGLNIQSASMVILCEPQLKPSLENQAISRAYRMGQNRNVLVHRLLCTNSIDEKLIKLLEEKQQLFDEFADKSVAAEQQKEVDETSFGKLIDEEIERIKNKKTVNDNI